MNKIEVKIIRLLMIISLLQILFIDNKLLEVFLIVNFIIDVVYLYDTKMK